VVNLPTNRPPELSKLLELRDEFLSGGLVIMAVALITLVITVGRLEAPPDRVSLSSATGEPMRWTIEEKPDAVRFRIGETDFRYDVFAGDVDTVVHSLHREGTTTVLYAPAQSLAGRMFHSGPVIWEVRHGSDIIRSYADIRASRNFSALIGFIVTILIGAAGFAIRQHGKHLAKQLP
jgi:hypothetical protein